MELEMRMIRRTEYTMKEMALELAMRMERKTEQMALELTMELARRMMRPTNLTFRYPLLLTPFTSMLDPLVSSHLTNAQLWS